MANQTAEILCSVDDCEIVDFTAPATYAAGDFVMIGDTPMIILRGVSSGGHATGVVKCPWVELNQSTSSSAGVANGTIGNALFLDTGDMGVAFGTTGNSAGLFRCGVVLETKAKTAGTVQGSFDASLFMAHKGATRA